MDIFASETSLNPFDKAETHDDVGMGETFAQTLIIYEKKVAALVWGIKKNLDGQNGNLKVFPICFSSKLSIN